MSLEIKCVLGSLLVTNFHKVLGEGGIKKRFQGLWQTALLSAKGKKDGHEMQELHNAEAHQVQLPGLQEGVLFTVYSTNMKPHSAAAGEAPKEVGHHNKRAAWPPICTIHKHCGPVHVAELS
jgi:hypothetical protein